MISYSEQVVGQNFRTKPFLFSVHCAKHYRAIAIPNPNPDPNPSHNLKSLTLNSIPNPSPNSYPNTAVNPKHKAHSSDPNPTLAIKP